MSIERGTKAAIVQRPGVMGGSPIVDGTRVRVSDIVRYRRLDINVREALPFLDDAQVDAAVAYYAAHKTEIDAEIAEEEQLAR